MPNLDLGFQVKTLILAIVVLNCMVMTEVAADETIELRQPLLRHPDRAELGFPASGRLRKIRFEEGKSVALGEVLAEIENDHEKAQLDLQTAKSLADEPLQTARVRVSAAKRAKEAAEDANRKHARTIPAQETRRLELDLELAQAELAEKEYEKRIAALELAVAKSTYEATILRAPFAGIVTRRYMSVGTTTDTTRPVAQIVDVSMMRVEGYLSLADAKQVHVGDKIMVVQSNGRQTAFSVGFVDIGAQQVQKLIRVWGQATSNVGLMEGETITARVITAQGEPNKESKE